MSSTSTLNLKIEFGGGLELLFGNVRSYKITIPVTAPATASGSKPERPADVTFLIQWLKDNLLKERSELFVDTNGEDVCVRSFCVQEERY
jgi:ubiquitin related modifier 1